MATVNFRLRDQTTAAVDGVLIRIYSGATLITTGITGEGDNSSGNRIFDLDVGDYTARFSMSGSGYTIVSPQAFTVIGDDTDDFTISVERLTRPVSTNPALCRCSGYVIDLAGQPLKNASVTFEGRNPPTLLGNDYIGKDRLVVVSDKSGYLQTDLIRNGVYRVVVSSYQDLTFEIKVPNLSSANLPDVIFPIVTAVQFDPEDVSVGIAESVTSDCTVVYRSGLAIPVPDFESTTPVSLKTSDKSVATAKFVDGVVEITGISAGTCTISAVRDYEDSSESISLFPAPGDVSGEIMVTVS
jgi:hypothetical protein